MIIIIKHRFNNLASCIPTILGVSLLASFFVWILSFCGYSYDAYRVFGTISLTTLALMIVLEMYFFIDTLLVVSHFSNEWLLSKEEIIEGMFVYRLSNIECYSKKHFLAIIEKMKNEKSTST